MSTDVDALACEPGVAGDDDRPTRRCSRAADVVVLPGSRSTVADLEWLRRTGLADAFPQAAGAGRPVLGMCGGYQMLGRAHRRPGGIRCRTGGWSRVAADRGGVRCAKSARPTGRVGGGERGARVRDPPRRRAAGGRRPVAEPFLDGWPGGTGLGHHVARRLRERRLPPGLAESATTVGRATVSGRAGSPRFPASGGRRCWTASPTPSPSISTRVSCCA